MKNVRWRKSLLSIYGVSFLLCGCQDKGIEYDLNTQKEERQEISPLELESGGDWKEEFTTNSGKDVDIDCRVKIPDVEQMVVAEVQKATFDEEYHKEIIQMLYGTLDVYSNEETDWSKEMVKEKIDWIDSRIQVWEEQWGYSSDQRRKESLRNGIEELQQEKIYYTDLYNRAKEKLDYTEDFTKQSYIGTYLSCNYLLDFSEDENGTAFTFQAEDYENIFPMQVENFIQRGYGGEIPVSEFTGENQCELTVEDAKEIAEKTLLSMGWFPEAEEATVLEWHCYSGSELREIDTVNGYNINYYIGLEGLEVGAFDLGYELVAERSGYTLGTAHILVDDRGVVKVEVKNPVKLISMTENVKLLSLDSVKGIIRKEIDNHPDKYLAEIGVTSFFDMELNYIKVKDRSREGYYSYVPVWRLCKKNSEDEKGIRPVSSYPVIINAIDGSVIDLKDVVE